ncbi:MAG TPA: PIN domain-containing protein [Acidobacteriaceae bacterium]|nr:PIN domain-containing protein [Acidobacteriaceae bacterium]
MPTGRRYCWDSCVFISLLTKLGRTDEELAHLVALETLCDDGDVYIFTPSITLIEVLACKLTPEQETLFQGMLQRSNVEVVSVSRRIATIAREIRNHYRMIGEEIAVPDSIHIATAIHFGATALHTYDGCGKRKRKMDLLSLPVPIIGKYDLTICKPTPPPESTPEIKELITELRTPSLFERMEAGEYEEGSAMPSTEGGN